MLSLQSCPILCDPMDCSPPGSSLHGILQARVLEWGAIAVSNFPYTKLKKAKLRDTECWLPGEVEDMGRHHQRVQTFSYKVTKFEDLMFCMDYR